MILNLKAFAIFLLSVGVCVSFYAGASAYSKDSAGTQSKDQPEQTGDLSHNPLKKHKPKKEKQLITDPIAQGKELLASRCSTCHTAPAPTVHALSDWPAVLNRMAPRAFLSPDEEKLIMQYFQSVLQAKN